jgi:hypothetical protein
MESSFGVGIRKPWNLLSYSAVVWWYARPGATHNRPPQVERAAQSIVSLSELDARAKLIRQRNAFALFVPLRCSSSLAMPIVCNSLPSFLLP